MTDNVPEEWKDCEHCGGEGGFEKHCMVYEAGCGFPHDDSEWVRCEECDGRGGWIQDSEGDPDRIRP
ncbi:hypothetical protein [Bradyrhizobium cenepequi]|uniref:hypothetical protein n=1 Tax=Bradyrhizobium cenepequi TaxID=2821403 RepID=UPI001CE3858D|nr:hypothetical protein [Bradyrhizobium cenepequi]MCA6108074.1 hypothetical protein [Bradyrhizobium cenepequi]